MDEVFSSMMMYDVLRLFCCVVCVSDVGEIESQRLLNVA
jgi:hypothetical protein